jgi:hypothetical protein
MNRKERKLRMDAVHFKHAALGKGFVTMAYFLDPGADDDAWVCAVALCAPGDSFNRKRGRHVALRRLSELLRIGEPGGRVRPRLAMRRLTTVMSISSSDGRPNPETIMRRLFGEAELQLPAWAKQAWENEELRLLERKR